MEDEVGTQALARPAIPGLEHQRQGDVRPEHSASTATDQSIGTPNLRLRDYQLDAVARIRATFKSGSRRVLFQLPTGGGKTVCFAYIIAGAVKRGRRVLILTHRAEILEQIQAAIELTGERFGITAPGFDENDAPVQIASIASLAQPRRLERWRDRFDFIVIDECHHAVSLTWARVITSQPRALILGVTATPERLDGRGLGEIFDDLVIGPSTAELDSPLGSRPPMVFEPIAGPDLSDARIRAGDYAVEDMRDAMDGVVIGAAVNEYPPDLSRSPDRRLLHRRPALAGGR